MKLTTNLGYSAAIAAASVGLMGLYIKMTLPPPASERVLDREMVKNLALTGGLVESRTESAPLLNVHVIVTGATSGLGREIACELYGLGATVILASRSAKKTADVAGTIMQEYPDSQGALIYEKTIDTSSLDSVREFSDWYTAKFGDTLHVLVNNAGIHYASLRPSPLKHLDMDTKSIDGYDSAFATNYLGHFLLTRLLTPSLLKTEASEGRGGRVVNVASSYHLQSDGTMLYSHNGEMPEAARSDIHTAKHRSRSYANNKLAQVLHAKELQRRLFSSKGPGIKLRAFSSCPAWASTNILPKNAGGSFVSRAAFRPKAAILGVLGAILDTKTFQGGEFVAVFKNRIMHQWWARPLMKLATQLGVRDAPSQISWPCSSSPTRTGTTATGAKTLAPREMMRNWRGTFMTGPPRSRTSGPFRSTLAVNIYWRTSTS